MWKVDTLYINIDSKLHDLIGNVRKYATYTVDTLFIDGVYLTIQNPYKHTASTQSHSQDNVFICMLNCVCVGGGIIEASNKDENIYRYE